MPPVPTTKRGRAGDAARLAVLPLVPPLQVEAGPAVLGVRDHRAQHVLGDRPVKHAPRVGHHDVGVPQLIEEQGVDPGRSDVDPLELPGVGPDIADGRREEVPEQQGPRAPDSLGEPVGGAVAKLDLQSVETGRRSVACSHSTATDRSCSGHERPRLGIEPYDCQQSACLRPRGPPDWGHGPVAATASDRDRCRRTLRLRARPGAVAVGAGRRQPAHHAPAVRPVGRDHGDGGAHLRPGADRRGRHRSSRRLPVGHRVRVHVGKLRRWPRTAKARWWPRCTMPAHRPRSPPAARCSPRFAISASPGSPPPRRTSPT